MAGLAGGDGVDSESQEGWHSSTGRGRRADRGSAGVAAGHGGHGVGDGASGRGVRLARIRTGWAAVEVERTGVEPGAGALLVALASPSLLDGWHGTARMGLGNPGLLNLRRHCVRAVHSVRVGLQQHRTEHTVRHLASLHAQQHSESSGPDVRSHIPTQRDAACPGGDTGRCHLGPQDVHPTARVNGAVVLA